MKRALLAALCCGSLLCGCGVEAVVSVPSSGSSTAEPSPSRPAQELPDGVPLPPGALLVSGPTQVKARGQVAGWAAVATQSADTSSADTRSFYRGQLPLLGWSVSVDAAHGEGWTIAGQRQLAIGVLPAAQGLQVSVTEPLTSSGPAITIRFVTTPDVPAATASPARPATPRPSISTSTGGRR